MTEQDKASGPVEKTKKAFSGRPEGAAGGGITGTPQHSNFKRQY